VHAVFHDGVVSTRITRPAADDTAAAIIDAVSGRGSVELALAGCEPAVVHRLGALARFFDTEP
jgi:hypothetical protein